ncbi:MAG: beta-ketoacyl-[acyl-carrier-protein] synthase family protein [Gemmatimonadetes bacterium]|uniref:3-oxoacyl-[acyl-carrier-protein] synthase 2 n=1 Tax=Candidatus Kutchimonas denitrificans TaxID=3056748 RepID=A0AAE5CAS1_9BACT|nr:beta-ketoacyl-[acyl-carrier-protein] synthase family protein [Gemmatimonadota bacterium]NIR74867.1 beta-ketoacyl-[acyl-carrier-protein] synthase family protein [Candidatus Kutchimonas denitrificans]NIR99978.1 beta-ketoacyl-[acyl-carrier-protein] synthase family protein [Gemmatimonadota bacterium]NIT65562.1 beta-ketoacyl-[acyl-carrier-protein] synthase family protein [Gemmatimonadota bacterium]NIU52532.1 beta-ketoacyl-ACP synthase II [Gemmatimonadota bacterium]
MQSRDGRRVAVTGIGCITPIGTGTEGLWDGLRLGASAVRELTRFDPSRFRSRMAAEVERFDPADHMDAKRAKRLDRYGQFSVAAARMALADAELAPESLSPDRVAVQMGSALGGVAFAESQHHVYVEKGPSAVNPLVALAVFTGAASCNIAIEFGFTGPNSTNGMSCASGAIAVGRGFELIRGGGADAVLVGGIECPLAPLSYGAFALIRAMSKRNDDPATASRPFDRDRDGFVMGEGAAVLVLEEWGRAVARDARIYAELCGFGTTNDAYHMTAPRPDGAQSARAIELALAGSGGDADDLEYVNAHASSTRLNDPVETRAIKSALGARARGIPVSGTKGYYGHPLGASGAIEAAITALSMERGWLPPTLNLSEPDPECDLDLVAGAGRAAGARFAISNSFGFGGINATLVFRRE